MSGGKYVRRRKRLLGDKKKLLFLAVNVGLSVLALVCALRLQYLCTLLPSQTADERWRGESEQRFAQVSAFLPVDQTMQEQDVFMLRTQLEQAMTEASLQAPEGGSLYADAYSGTANVTVSGPSGTVTVKTIGVGGDFFLFHPLSLCSGSYLTSRDYMADRVVLDEELAWALFGSNDVAGQEVMIGSRTYPVAGVVSREADFASEKAFTEDAGMFMSIEALQLIEEVPIDCYEIAMPDPISGWAATMLEEELPREDFVVVENSRRYSLWSLIGILGQFGERSMNTHAIIYPYWENAARLTEDYAALMLLLTVLFALCPAICLITGLIRAGKKQLRSIKEKTTASIGRRVEERKERNYVRRGI